MAPNAILHRAISRQEVQREPIPARVYRGNVSLCVYASVVTRKGKFNKIQREKERERERREREREREEEILPSEHSVGNQFPQRITAVVRLLFVALSLLVESDRDLDSFSSDCELRKLSFSCYGAKDATTRVQFLNSFLIVVQTCCVLCIILDSNLDRVKKKKKKEMITGTHDVSF